MTGIVTVTAPAKVNLSLGVGERRADGFHPLATVYQAIGLFDQVRVSHAGTHGNADVTVSVRAETGLSVMDVPTDETNIAVQAVRLLARHHEIDLVVRRGVDIVIDKGIPVAGGMAGGSADAAATLLACDRLWGFDSPLEDLVELAAELGSDVPFALVGGTAIGSGRGELVVPLMSVGTFWWVVLTSSQGLSTPAVYRQFDLLQEGSPLGAPEIPDALMTALRGHDMAELGAALSNDLQEAALVLRPELQRALEIGLAESAHGAVLSGSGPSCLFLCESRAHAGLVADGLEAAGLGPVSFAPGPVPGARVIGRDPSWS